MRLVVCTLGVLGASAISLALADPPATPAAAPAATRAPATSPAAPAAASSTSAPAAAKDTSASEVDNLDKHFLSEGYKIEMHGGTKLFCRREEELGSRLGGQKVCSTAQQLQATEREAQAAYQRGQSQQNNPSGR
jgi:hypothetical protein